MLAPTMPGRRLALLLALAGAAGAPACANRIHHHAEYERGRDYSALRTYAWITDAPMIGQSPDAANLKDPAAAEARIRGAVEHQLGARGFTKVPREGADFLVAFSLGLRVTEVALGYNAEEFGLVWHSKGGETHRKGELSIDLFDPKTRAHIWHGSAAKQITESDDPGTLVDQAAALILSQFPPPPGH